LATGSGTCTNNPNAPNAYPNAIAAFHAGLREMGFNENENVATARLR
jgi:hypothetical protein